MPQKWMKMLTEKHHKEHLERVKYAHAAVDCGPPREKMKTNRTVEKLRKGFIIERDNRILLDRLGAALELKNIDNENPYYREKREKLSTRHSALSGKAQIELAKITSDNKELLKRIENVLPTYSFNQFEAEELLHKKHLKVLTEYPDSYAEDPQLKNSQTRKMSNKQLMENMVDPNTGEFQYMHAMPLFSNSRSAKSYQYNRTKLLGDEAVMSTTLRSGGQSRSSSAFSAPGPFTPASEKKRIAAQAQAQALGHGSGSGHGQVQSGRTLEPLGSSNNSGFSQGIASAPGAGHGGR